MNDFHRQNEELWCEEVPLRTVAEAVGTPFYLYSGHTLQRHYRVFHQAFAGRPHLVCFAVKSNENLAVLRIFLNEGSGVDIVSGGELYRALRAGADPNKIVYSGVGKRKEEIAEALEAGILMFNVESAQELLAIEETARRLDKKAGISLRINPDVDPATHPHISTGLRENKFGIPIAEALAAYRHARTLSHVEIRGISCHIGSQVTKVSPFVDALDRIKGLIEALANEGIRISHLDLGGGLGITYRDEEPPPPDVYARAILGAARDIPCTLVLEPGRVLVGNAGVLVTSVLYTKENQGKHFVVVDAGMNDLIRPSLYDSYHGIAPVGPPRPGSVFVDVVGPICESGDFFARSRSMAPVIRGDLLAVMSAGAYGFSMASNYNARVRCAEVLVQGDRFHVIRERETYADLVRGEAIPAFLLS